MPFLAFNIFDFTRGDKNKVEVEKRFYSGFSTFLLWLQSPSAICLLPYANQSTFFVGKNTTLSGYKKSNSK